MLISTVVITCFGSSFVIGYNLGIMNLPGDRVKNFTSNYIKDAPSPAFLYALVSAVFVVTGAIGSFSSGVMAESLGRRNTLIMNNAFSIIGAILTGPCVVAQSPALLYIGRIVTGFNAGISMGVASLYLTEVSPRDIRGAVGACHQLAVTIGILVAYILTLDQLFNTETLWPLAVGLGAVPATISLFLLPLCPESPRFLFTNKEKEYEARKAFVKLNSKENVDIFIGELREEMEAAQHQPKFRFSQIFTRRDLRMPILLACLIQIQQQLSGINAVITYSSTMLKTAGLADDKIQYCVIGIGAFNVLVTLISVSLLERVGRRQLLLWPAVVLAISLLALTITVTLANQFQGESGAKILGIVSAVFIFVYIGAFAIGLGPVPAMIVSEMFRQEPRAAAYALSQGIQWLSNLLVLISYPSIDNSGITSTLILTVFITCFGSSGLYGYATGIMNLPGNNIKKFITDNIKGADAEFMYALVSAVYVVAGAIGSFSSSVMAENLGRKGKEYEARKAFAKLNSKEDPDQFMEEVKEEMAEAEKRTKFKFGQIFTSKDLRMPMLLACLIQIQQQLSGINAVIAYSSTMLKTAGLGEGDIQYCVVGVGAFNVVMTIVSLPLIERAGRRPMLLWPAVVLALSLLILTITVVLAKKHDEGTGAAKNYGIASAVFIFVYIGAFAVGLGPVPAMIVSEMFRQEPRAAAYAISQGVQWLSNLLVLISYPNIDVSGPFCNLAY
ncbi:Solute carrier family 2 facilitated glucose [Fasciolopsis buskii]|uniref:Solute carrier family 2 facilitated glucose n=1 Tax=Fasciolopsis buskii TaxID=27845 RepID=A0A8E0VKB8_9TREM|nr:Solute carrier family 2 facilitated glucose [Fasciolopsis buski]